MEHVEREAVTIAPTATELRNAYDGRRVLVTGHTGFKGSWLALWLHDLGAAVTGYALAPATSPAAFEVMDLPSCCEHVVGDVRDLTTLCELVRRVQPDVVFHLAAQPIVRLSYEQPVDTIATNVMGTTHLLEAVRRMDRPCAVVVVTSDKCYENREWVYGYREDEPMGGHDVYSMSKGASELVVSSYRRSFFAPKGDVMLASARAGNVVGGGDWSADRIVVDAVRALAERRPIGVRNPAATRPWQHVIEPLAGYLLLGARLLGPQGASFSSGWNFGPRTEIAHPVRDVVSELIRHWGEGSWEQAGSDLKHEARLLRLSIDKATSLLGWRPRWGFRETFRRTVEWYRTFYAGAGADALRDLTRSQISAYLAAVSDDGDEAR